MKKEIEKMLDIAIEPLEKNELGKLKGGFGSFSIPGEMALYASNSVSVSVSNDCSCSCSCNVTPV